jgi:hypothetical protein
MPPSWPVWESKDPDPPIEQRDPSQNEAKLISIAHEHLERICAEWAGEDGKLTAEYCQAKNNLEKLQIQLRSETDEHQKAISDYDEAKKAFSHHPPRWIPLGLYWAIFGIITGAEGLFNYFVFQIFGQSEAETWMMAAGIVCVIPLASKLIGHSLKKETKSLIDVFGIICSTVALVALLAGLSILRESFFEASKIADAIEIPIGSFTFTAILIAFNMAIFIILTFLSYVEARKDPEEYRKARRTYQEAEATLKKEGGDVERVGKELAEAEERFINAHTARESAFEKYQFAAQEERDKAARYIRTYRQANLNARKDKGRPESFTVDPETLIKIPEVLETLDWSCPGEEEAEKRS